MKISVGVAVLLLLPMAASAQGNPGPFGGLFGRTPERVGKDYRVFEIRTVATGQLEDALNDTEEARQPSRWIGSGGLSGMFEQRSDRLNLVARSHANYLQYFEAPYNGGTSVESTANMSYKLATRLSLDAGLSHLYTPFFQFHPNFFSFAPNGALVPPATPYVATVVESQSYSAMGGVTIPYSKHSTVSASFERRETRFEQESEADLSLIGMRGAWTRQVTRDFQVKLGYGRDRVQLYADEEHLYETIDAGINYLRPLSPGRRTTFGVHTEMARVETPQFGRHFRVNGGLNVSRWFGKTGLLDFYLQRATDFVAGFAAPLQGDTVGVRVSAMPSPRAELMLQLDGGKGYFGFDSGVGRFTTATSVAQFGFAVSRSIGVFVQHSTFYYELPQSASLVAPVAHLARQTMTFGMTTWIPIYTRERSPSDTR